MSTLLQAILLAILGAFIGTAEGQSTRWREGKKSIERKKFFFSIGGGFAQVSASSEVVPYPNYRGGINTSASDVAFATTFRLGVAVTPYWVFYYENKVCFVSTYTLENDMTTKRESLFGYGLTGVGITRFLRPSAPSVYFNFAAGVAQRKDLETASAYAEKGTGLGLAFGGGFQFANHGTLELNLISGDVSANPKYDSPWKSQFLCVQVSLNYVYFSSYKSKKKGKR